MGAARTLIGIAAARPWLSLAEANAAAVLHQLPTPARENCHGEEPSPTFSKKAINNSTQDYDEALPLILP
jgi:hypothetical protein